MSVTVEKRVTYRAMCERCRELSRWWNTPAEAVAQIDGHRCEAVE